jgi:hypothetical protein
MKPEMKFAEWKEEGLRAVRKIVRGAECVLRLSGGGPNIEALKKAQERLEAVTTREAWFREVKEFNAALKRVDNELRYRFGMSYEAAEQYG